MSSQPSSRWKRTLISKGSGPILSVLVLLLAVICHHYLPEHPISSIRADGVKSNLEVERKLQEVLGGKSILFEALDGDRPGQFVAQANGYQIRLAPQGISLWSRAQQQIEMRFLNAAQPIPTGKNALPGRVHYLHGNDRSQWRTDIIRFQAVEYSQLYPGVDLVFYGNGTQSEFDFIVDPGVDPDSIRFVIDGAEALQVNEEGTLRIRLAEASFEFKTPRIYQTADNGHRIQVPGRYRLEGDTVAFEIETFDPDRKLVIDPVILYSTYVGNLRSARVEGVAIDSAGNTYAGGYVFLLDGDEFTGVNAIRDEDGEKEEAFIVKFNRSGSIRFLTLFGGNEDERVIGLTIDSEGRPWFTGWTSSSDFPKAGAFQSTLSGSSDAFITQLTSAGDDILFSSLLGGSSSERLDPNIFGIANAQDYGDIVVDESGNAYVTGVTSSNNFPTVGAFQGSGANNALPSFDAFVAKIGTDRTLVYSSYLGGSGDDIPTALALDSSGQLYVGGGTNSMDFPTVSAIRDTYQSEGDSTDNPRLTTGEGFLSLISQNGGELLTSTYLGGAGDDDGVGGIVVGASDEVHVFGHTNAILEGVAVAPQVAGAPEAEAQPLSLSDAPLGDTDLFLIGFQAGAQQVQWSGYLGGCFADISGGITMADGLLYVTGHTFSFDFPLLDPIVGVPGGGGVAFVTAVDPLDQSIAFSSYLSGRNSSQGRDIAANSNAFIHIGGGSPTGYHRTRDFPLVREASRGVTFGQQDGFSTLITPARGELLGSGPEWTRHIRLDTNQNGFPDPGDEIVTAKTSFKKLELTSARSGLLEINLIKKTDGVWDEMQINHDVLSDVRPDQGKPRAQYETDVLLASEGGIPTLATVNQTRFGIEASVGRQRSRSEQGGTIRMLDQNGDQIYDAISLEPDEGPNVIVSIELRDVDGDGQGDFATLPWNLARLLGARATNEEAMPQPFIPLADTNEDGIPDSPAFDFDEDDIADADYPRLPLSGPTQAAEHRLYFAHFGEGAGVLFSQLLLFPLRTSGEVNARVILRDNGGLPLEVDLNGQVVTGETSIVVPASGLVILETDGNGPVVQGSVTVISDQPLGGVVLFGGPAGVAGVGSSPELGEGFRTPIEENEMAGVRSGVAVQNLENQGVSLVLRLLDADGTELASVNRQLAALGHLAIFIEELFESIDLADFLGTLVVEADGRVTATVLQTYPGEFVTMPVAGLADFSRNLLFAHFGDGGDLISSKFLIMNIDPKYAGEYFLSVTNDAGSALPLDLDGDVFNGFVPQVPVSSGGISRRETDGAGDVISGSLSLAGGPGQFAGVIVFGGVQGVAGVGASPIFNNGFIAPVDVQVADMIDTGIAIRNVRSNDGVVNLELFDAEGNLLATLALPVPQRGHDARFLSQYEWVAEPGVELDFSSFRGLIKARAKRGITGTVLQVRGGSQFATMPTSPIQD